MSSKRSTRHKPRQTRLNFTPIHSSSPSAAGLSPDVRNRAAAINYIGSPSSAKRRRTTGEADKMRGADRSAESTSELPSQLHYSAASATMTPQIKRELGHADSSSESNEIPVLNSQRSRATFLNSGRKGNRSEAVSGQPRQAIPIIKKEERGSSAGAPESGSSSEDIPARKRMKQATPRSTLKSKIGLSPEISEPLNRRQMRLSRQNGRFRSTVGSSEDDTASLEVVQKSSRALSRDSDFGEPESSGDEALASSPGFLSKKRRVKKAVEVYSEDEESEEDLPVSTRKRRAPPISESDDEAVEQRTRRKSPSALRQEQEDLAEDLEFLGPSPRKLNIPRHPRSIPQTTNARQRALEELKRRRAGEKDVPLGGAKQPHPRRRRALYDTESESESDLESTQREEGDSDVDGLSDDLRSTVRQATTLDMFQEDDEDEDFVIEDDEETLGVPDDDARVPLAFSSISLLKTKDLFKYAVEWMVQKKLNPGFAKDDEIYQITFKKLDDEVRGLAGSKFTSSAWTRDFTRALHARPRIDVVQISATSRLTLENHCGACNRRSHPATWDIQFSGKAYRGDTLSDVEEDSSESEELDGEGSEDGRSVDASGHLIPPQDTIFHVGVFCKNNAETAHTLAHWRWHLYDWVKDYLKSRGHLDPAKIVERDGWKTKKKTKYANKVVDEMQESGEIKRLHQDFRATINTAREAKQSGWHRHS